jgi:hypothetical protein
MERKISRKVRGKEVEYEQKKRKEEGERNK